jgi:hypothetical protein
MSDYKEYCKAVFFPGQEIILDGQKPSSDVKKITWVECQLELDHPGPHQWTSTDLGERLGEEGAFPVKMTLEWEGDDRCPSCGEFYEKRPPFTYAQCDSCGKVWVQDCCILEFKDNGKIHHMCRHCFVKKGRGDDMNWWDQI